MKRINLSTALVPALSILALGVLTWPVWMWLWHEWMANDYYSHGLLVLPVAVFLGVQRFRNDKAFVWQAGRNSLGGALLLVISLALFLYFLNDRALYLAAFATVGLIAGLIWTFGGLSALQRLAFPVAYLALMIPLPIVERVTLPLALFTGVCSSALIRLLGLDINIVGNSVSLPNADLVIGAQCSGINSMIALIALTTLTAYLLNGPAWGRVLLVLLAIPLALVGNILRVTTLLVVARSWGVDAGFTFYHDYSGPIFFVVALLLLLPASRALQLRTLRLEVI